MVTEHIRTEGDLINDPRLLAAVPAVVEYTAGRAGLAAEAAGGLAAAAECACRDAFALSNGREKPIHFLVENFDDRIEVQIVSPPAHAAKAELPADLQEARRKKIVDRVDLNVQAGQLRLTLMKSL